MSVVCLPFGRRRPHDLMLPTAGLRDARGTPEMIMEVAWPPVVSSTFMVHLWHLTDANKNEYN